jgi:hypothetical protein
VSSNRRIYGPGGSYAHMYAPRPLSHFFSEWRTAGIVLSFFCPWDRAGVDAARAFGTGCFKEHRTHDLRGLSESEIQVKRFVPQYLTAFPLLSDA